MHTACLRVGSQIDVSARTGTVTLFLLIVIRFVTTKSFYCFFIIDNT